LSQPAAEKILVIKYLNMMGEKLHFFFTLEDNVDRGYPRAYRTQLTPDFNISTIDEVMEFIDRELQNYRVVRSSRRPSVIHIIAKDLPKDGYLLDQPVTAEYKGRLQFFVDYLGNTFDGVLKSPKSGLIGDPAGDLQTEIDVKLEKMTVRDTLTEVVPLGEYRPFLWQFEARTKDGSTEYIAIFMGRRPAPPKFVSEPTIID